MIRLEKDRTRTSTLQATEHLQNMVFVRKVQKYGAREWKVKVRMNASPV